MLSGPTRLLDLRQRGVRQFGRNAAHMFESMRDGAARLFDGPDQRIVGLRRPNEHASPALCGKTRGDTQEHDHEKRAFHVRPPAFGTG